MSSVFPVFFAFYLGSWCDTFGRKLCILLFLVAKVLGNVILILVAYYLESAKEWYLFALIPTAVVGTFTTFDRERWSFQEAKFSTLESWLWLWLGNKL